MGPARPLTGKIVFITGGARGIGRATASALVAKGARVVIGDLDGELASRTAAELGGGVQAVHLDVTDHVGFTAVLDRIENEVGPIDVLINNAGVMPIGPFEDDTHESAYRQFSINVFALMHGTREAIRRMKPRGHGHIVNVASMAGVVPIPGGATYSASKHAVVGLCESLAWELRGTGIELSYVLPSLVNTELAAGVRRSRAANTIEPEVVAREIAGTLERPRLAVYAPRSMGMITKLTGLIPRRLGDRIMTASGSDHLLADSVGDPGRVAYEARIAASAPGAERRGADSASMPDSVDSVDSVDAVDAPR